MTHDMTARTGVARNLTEQVPARTLQGGFIAGASVGVLGGLIGLGGAEFRLPLLIGVFGFLALQAVILNKAMSLVVVAVALPARLLNVPLNDVIAEWHVIANLLAGSLIGAWLGASWATRMASGTLYRVLAALLVLIAAALAADHIGTIPQLDLPPGAQLVAGLIAGLGIGIVAALMGVAGGELLIPAIVLLYPIDVKLAGSLSLAISLPYARRLRPLQPRRNLHRPERTPPLRHRHGGRLGRRHNRRGHDARRRPDQRAHPPAGRPTPGLSGQGVAARPPLTSRAHRLAARGVSRHIKPKRATGVEPATFGLGSQRSTN